MESLSTTPAGLTAPVASPRPKTEGAEELVRVEGVTARNGDSILLSKAFLDSVAAGDAGNGGKALLEELTRQMGNGDAQYPLSLSVPPPKTTAPGTDNPRWFGEGGMVHYKKEGGTTTITIETKDGPVSIVITKRVGYTPGRDLGKLARVSTSADVRSLIIGLRADMGRYRNDPFADEAEIKAAIRQMERVIERAHAKIRKLDQEALLEQLQRKAEQNRDAGSAHRLSGELKRRRALRQAGEYAEGRLYTQTGQADSSTTFSFERGTGETTLSPADMPVQVSLDCLV